MQRASRGLSVANIGFGARDTRHNPIDQPDQFDHLSTLDKEIVLDWIGACFAPSPGAHASAGTSYSMKHWFEEEAGIYLTNGAFKGAMLAAGYQPVDTSLLNWEFRCRWMAPCEAKTRKGHNCQRSRLPQYRFCWLHHRMAWNNAPESELRYAFDKAPAAQPRSEPEGHKREP